MKALILKQPILVDKFFRNLDVKKPTQESYQKGLLKFFDYLRENKISLPNREHIIAWKKEQLENKSSAQTINLYLSAIRRYFSFLEAEGKYPNITASIKGCRRPKGHQRNSLTETQARRLLECVPKNNIVGLRDYALINLMIKTGMRQIEIVTANVEDIGEKDGKMVIWKKAKGHDEKDEFNFLFDESYNPIMDYLKTRKNPEPSEPLFIAHSNRANGDKRLSTRAVRQIVARRLSEANLKSPRTTTHSLRHTFGSIASEEVDIYAVQSAMGHENINTTLKYIHKKRRVESCAERIVCERLRNKE